MVVIFGWGAGEAQDLGEVAPVTCPNCHNDVFLHHIKSEKRVSLYFVPLVPYGSNEYVACPICHGGLQLRPEQVPAVTQMRATTLAFRHGRVRQDGYLATVARFWRTLGVAPSGRQVVHPATGIPPHTPARATRATTTLPGATASPGSTAPPGAPSLAAQLAELGRLHADGVLTDEEFEAAKHRLLGS